MTTRFWAETCGTLRQQFPQKQAGRFKTSQSNKRSTGRNGVVPFRAELEDHPDVGLRGRGCGEVRRGAPERHHVRVPNPHEDLLVNESYHTSYQGSYYYTNGSL